MTCAHLQVKGELRHASQVDHWLKVLKQDSRPILLAASMASKAADYLHPSPSRAKAGRMTRINRAFVRRLEEPHRAAR